MIIKQIALLDENDDVVFTKALTSGVAIDDGDSIAGIKFEIGTIDIIVNKEIRKDFIYARGV